MLISLIVGCSDDSISLVNNTTQPLQTVSQSELAMRNLDAAQIERGKVIYSTNCVSCHGQNGEGTPDWRKTGTNGKYPPPPLNGTAHTWHHSTATLKETILKGTPPELGSMPAWEGRLTEPQIDDVIVWIISLWPDEVYDVWSKNFENND